MRGSLTYTIGHVRSTQPIFSFSSFYFRWFSGFNWQALQRLALPAPIVPTVNFLPFTFSLSIASSLFLSFPSFVIFRCETVSTREISKDILRSETFRRTNFQVGTRTFDGRKISSSIVRLEGGGGGGGKTLLFSNDARSSIRLIQEDKIINDTRCKRVLLGKKA